MPRWEHYAVCKCGLKFHAPSGNLFFVNVACCPECGEDKPQWAESHRDWPIRRMRWISTASWWRPKTWFTGYWQTHPQDLLL